MPCSGYLLHGCQRLRHADMTALGALCPAFTWLHKLPQGWGCIACSGHGQDTRARLCTKLEAIHFSLLTPCQSARTCYTGHAWDSDATTRKGQAPCCSAMAQGHTTEGAMGVWGAARAMHVA